MLLEMFVNELSLAPAAADVSTGQVIAKQFVLTMTAATARGVGRVLRIPEDFFAKLIAPSYDWYHWLQDNRVDREIRRYFLSIATKAPFLRDEPGVEAIWAGIDCYWGSQPAMGLKAAYVADGLALSLASRPAWDCPLITCEIQDVVDEDVFCRSESIHHASSSGHVDQQTGWIQQRIQTSVAGGKELWRCFREFFPSLVCCSGVEQHVMSLPSESLASITRGLFRLNGFCAGWHSGAFDPKGIQGTVSPESASTLQQFAGERTFVCPDGESRVFSWHVKLGKWRIYFDPSPGPGHVLIGYIGKHLRTAKFR